MRSILSALMPIALLFVSTPLLAQSKGWKIEVLAPIGTLESTSFLPVVTRRVAINDVGQIAFVRPDGIYVREPSGTITKRIDEVHAPVVTGGVEENLNGLLNRISVGIDNAGVIYASQQGRIYRQAPGQPTETVLSTPGGLGGITIFGDLVVSKSGDAYVGLAELVPGEGFLSQIARWNGTSFDSIATPGSSPSSSLLLPTDAEGDSIVFQEFDLNEFTSLGATYVGQFRRVDGSTTSDISDLSIFGYANFIFGSPIALAPGGNFAVAQRLETPTGPNLHITQFIGTTETTFPAAGISNFIQTVAMGQSGGIAYAAADNFDSRGIFSGPDNAMDAILLPNQTIPEAFRRAVNGTVHDIADDGSAILTIITDSGESFLAKAVPLPSVVDLINPSFVDGLNGWQTTGEVVSLLNPTEGNTWIGIIGGGSFFQEIDLPSTPFQIELIRPGFYPFLPTPEVYLGDQLLTPELFLPNDPFRRYIVTDPTLLGRARVLFRIVNSNADQPVIIDGIRITAIPEVNGAMLIAGVAGMMFLWQATKGLMTRRQAE